MSPPAVAALIPFGVAKQKSINTVTDKRVSLTIKSISRDGIATIVLNPPPTD